MGEPRNIRTDLEIEAEFRAVEAALNAETNPLTYVRLLAIRHTLGWVLTTEKEPLINDAQEQSHG